MAKEVATELFIGTDKAFVFTVLNEDETAVVDITGWTLSWMVKKKLSHADSAALVTKSAVISGTYNSSPGTNTQVATVTVFDTDTDAASSGTFFYELKRMDAGAETVIAYGEIEFKRSVHRS